MKNIRLALLTAAVITYGSCKETKKEVDKASNEMEQEMQQMEETAEKMEESTMGQTITLAMNSASDSGVKGDVTFTQNGEEVKMVAKFSGLQPGSHAIHLHENGDCSAHDGKSAGGHWNPTDEKHGKWGEDDGFHKGDIGNFSADENGNATVEFATDKWCMDCDDENKNIIGRAVIVHQGKDDYTSQPSGDAGARVACTAITK